jgi:hypothetical protein
MEVVDKLTKDAHFVPVKTTHIVGQLRGEVNQLLLCLNNYAHFKLFIEHSMMITIKQEVSNRVFNINHTHEIYRDKYFSRKPIKRKTSSS